MLDPETDVDEVTAGDIRAEMRVIGVPTSVGGGNLDPQAGDLALTAGWGHAGQGGVTMPGKGKVMPRPYTPEERAAIAQGADALGLSAEEALAHLGDQAVDVYLNDLAYWRCVPTAVWSYTIGGYQVMKKWLSYRERPLLRRDLTHAGPILPVLTGFLIKRGTGSGSCQLAFQSPLDFAERLSRVRRDTRFFQRTE